MLPDDPDDQARLFYLLLLLLFLAGFFLFGRTQKLSKSVRDLAAWTLIFAMVIIAYGFRDTLRSALFPQIATQISPQTIELRRGRDGHFHAELRVNEEPVRFIVDTGASDIVLSGLDASRVGIPMENLRFTGRAVTANGVVATAPVRLDVVQFGDFVDRGVAARVNSGELGASLLGMSYLDRFSRIEISGDRMMLHR